MIAVVLVDELWSQGTPGTPWVYGGLETTYQKATKLGWITEAAKYGLRSQTSLALLSQAQGCHPLSQAQGCHLRSQARWQQQQWWQQQELWRQQEHIYGVNAGMARGKAAGVL